MVDAVDTSSKESYKLVGFVHSGGSAFYTDWTSDVVFSGNTYVSTPDMEVSLPENDGVLSKKECKVAIPLGDTFSQNISQLSHAPVFMTVSEVMKGVNPGPSQSTNTLFVGRVEIVRRNYRGRRDKILLTSLPPTARLQEINLGLPCIHTCIHNLGDRGCKVDLTALPGRIVTAVVASIDGRNLTIQTNATISSQADRFYHRGFVQRQGLNLGIREWRSASPLVFQLAKQAPDYWIGQTISVVVGCDKSIETCRTRFSNEENFAGAGFAMPAYNPNVEDAP